MNKLVKWLIGTGISIAIPVGLYFGFIHDVGLKNIEIDEDYKIEDIFEDLVDNCLDNTSKDGTISLTLKEKALNSAINNIIKENGADGVFPQAYCEFENGYYTFVVNIKADSFVPVGTKVVIKTKLEEKVREDYANQNCFVFRFANVAIGRIGSIQNVALPILRNFVSNDRIKDAIGEKAHCTVDITKGEIVYPLSGLKQDLENMLGTASGSLDLPLMGLIQTIFEEDLLHLNTVEQGALRFDVDCNNFTANPQYVEEYELDLNNESKYGGLTLNSINSSLQKILADNEGANRDNQTIFKYLVKGYNSLNNQEKEKISALDLKSMGESFDEKTYKGFNLTAPSLLENVVGQIEDLNSKDITSFKPNESFNLFKVTERDINSFLATTDMVGYNFLLSKEIKNGEGPSTYKTSYMAIDNFYCNIYEEETDFVIGLNLNGFETKMTISASLQNDKCVTNFASNQFKIAYKFNEIKLGDVTMNKSFTNDMSMILSSISTDALQIKKEGDGFSLTFDFSRAIGNNVNNTVKTILNSSSFDIECSGETKADNGTLAIKAKYSVGA